MNEAILEILADAFDCSAREANDDASTAPTAYHKVYCDGRRDAYLDVVKRLRRIVEGGTGIHAPTGQASALERAIDNETRRP